MQIVELISFRFSLRNCIQTTGTLMKLKEYAFRPARTDVSLLVFTLAALRSPRTAADLIFITCCFG